MYNWAKYEAQVSCVWAQQEYLCMVRYLKKYYSSEAMETLFANIWKERESMPDNMPSLSYEEFSQSYTDLMWKYHDVVVNAIHKWADYQFRLQYWNEININEITWKSLWMINNRLTESQKEIRVKQICNSEYLDRRRIQLSEIYQEIDILHHHQAEWDRILEGLISRLWGDPQWLLAEEVATQKKHDLEISDIDARMPQIEEALDILENACNKVNEEWYHR